MRIDPTSSLLVASVGLSFIPSTYAWGAAGHEIVATIAQIYLHPTVLPVVCPLLNFTSTDPHQPLCHLAPIATWADRIRYLPQYRYTAPLHYVGAVGDYPRDKCLFPGKSGWAGKKGGNVLSAIRNVTGVLEDWVDNDGPDDDTRANEALKFLVHFLGDMHMPLHLTGRDRGGNGDKVLFDGRQTNLHSLWDSFLIAQALRTIPHNYTRALPVPDVEYVLRDTIYDPYVRRVMWEGVLDKWSDEIDEWLDCPASHIRADTAVAAQTSWLNTAVLWRWIWIPWLSGVGSRREEEDADDSVLCPYHWAKPIHSLNCDIVWPKELDEPPYTHSRVHAQDFDEEFAGRKPRIPYVELDTPEYAGVIRDDWIVEKLLAMAGVRLAGVLNWLFAEGQDGEDGMYVYRRVEL